MLASIWACHCLKEYVHGLKFILETHHKPLVPLLTTTDLSKMAARILYFCLQMIQYNPTVLHIPSKCQILADRLSHAQTKMKWNEIKLQRVWRKEGTIHNPWYTRYSNPRQWTLFWVCCQLWLCSPTQSKMNSKGPGKKTQKFWRGGWLTTW